MEKRGSAWNEVRCVRTIGSPLRQWPRRLQPEARTWYRKRFCLFALSLGLLAILISSPAFTQSPILQSTPPSLVVLEPWGEPAGFPSLYRLSIDAFFRAEKIYRQGNYDLASKILESFWTEHPAGSREWAAAIADAQTLAQTKGANFGTPGCYCALRMLTECVSWRIRQQAATTTPVAHEIVLTLVLIGHSNGIQPSSNAELTAHSGHAVKHELNPLLDSGRSEWLDDSLFLFTEYVRAITDGRLQVKVRVLRLASLDVPVEVTERSLSVAGATINLLFASLAPGAMEKIWQSTPDRIRAETDWWWILYPSHVPEQYDDFAKKNFITGGMAVGPDDRSPAFVIDDLWVVRVPPSIGFGPYTKEERQAYLPQWLQHEFFHHLYRTYPELGLEASGHQWTNRNSWPRDFQGLIEADYYAESLHKRLQLASPALNIALRYQPPPPRVIRKLTVPMILGEYRSDPPVNNWLIGSIGRQGGSQPTLYWTNRAGVSWLLTPDFENLVLRTGKDNPYYSRNPDNGRLFHIVLDRSKEGEYIPEVSGFQFQGTFYKKVVIRKN